MAARCGPCKASSQGRCPQACLSRPLRPPCDTRRIATGLLGFRVSSRVSSACVPGRAAHDLGWSPSLHADAGRCWHAHRAICQAGRRAPPHKLQHTLAPGSAGGCAPVCGKALRLLSPDLRQALPSGLFPLVLQGARARAAPVLRLQGQAARVALQEAGRPGQALKAPVLDQLGVDAALSRVLDLRRTVVRPRTCPSRSGHRQPARAVPPRRRPRTGGLTGAVCRPDRRARRCGPRRAPQSRPRPARQRMPLMPPRSGSPDPPACRPMAMPA